MSRKAPAYHPFGYRGGYLLRGTPIWLDARRPRPLCIVTTLQGGLPPRHQRAVASDALARLLRQAGHRGGVLPTPYHRWVGIGGERLMLLPGLDGMGASGVLVQRPTQRLLFVGRLTRFVCPWPAADVLVVAAPAWRHDASMDAGALARVADAVDGLVRRSGHVFLYAESYPAAAWMAEQLRGVGIPVRPTGVLGRMLRWPSGGGRCVATLGVWRGRRRRGSVLGLDAGIGVLPRDIPRVAMGFYATASEVAGVAAQTGCHTLCVGEAPTEALPVLRVAGVRAAVRLVGAARQLSLAEVAGEN